MPVIELTTKIEAPLERVFDLSRSIDAHMASTAKTRERAVAGRVSGLIEEGETVTWEATHFWIRQRLTVRITRLNRPIEFEDEMVSGAFSRMKHRHTFRSEDSQTIMSDHFEFEAPLGILGRLAERLFLTEYMRSFLLKRNDELKAILESSDWKQYLVHQD